MKMPHAYSDVLQPMAITTDEEILHAQARRDEKEYLHTRGASALEGSEARRRDDSSARLGGATHMQSSTVAQRSAQSTSAASASAAAVEALGGSWATERPLTPAGQSSEQQSR